MIPSSNDLELVTSGKSNANLEYNLDMKVNFLNTKKGDFEKTVYDILKLCILIFLTIAIAINVHINVKKLQLEDKLNYNIGQLTRQCDKLNRNINRKIFYKRIYSDDFINDIKSSDREFSNLLGVDRNNDNSKSDIYSNRAIPPIQDQSINHQDVVIKINSSTDLQYIMTSLLQSENNSIDDLNKIRYFSRGLKGLQTSEIQNLTVKDNNIDDSVVNSMNEPQIERLRRSVEKARKARKGKPKKRRPLRSRKQSGPLVATFVGVSPEQSTSETDNIGPWMKVMTNHPYDFTKFYLTEHETSIEVTTSGLYMISVQIYYFGESKNYSYYVLLNSEGNNHKQLATCVSTPCNVTDEVTCNTNVITYLQRGDRLSVQQREGNRLINLREGYSHLQLVLLAENRHKTT